MGFVKALRRHKRNDVDEKVVRGTNIRKKLKSGFILCCLSGIKHGGVNPAQYSLFNGVTSTSGLGRWKSDFNFC